MQRNFLISITSQKPKRTDSIMMSYKHVSDYTEETIKDLSLFEDLKYDSVSLVDLLISLEEKYDVELTEDMSDLIDNLDSIGQFMDYILEKIRDVQ